MAVENLTMPSSTLVPFIEAQQVDHTSRYHLFEFVSINYIPKGRLSLTQNCQPSLWSVDTSKTANTNLLQVYENTDWILVPIEVKSQETLFGLGF